MIFFFWLATVNRKYNTKAVELELFAVIKQAFQGHKRNQTDDKLIQNS